MESSRRTSAHLIANQDDSEDVSLTTALAREKIRLEKKELWRKQVEQSNTYQVLNKIAKVMDKYYLDPLIGFIPGIGDFMTSLISVPFIYVSLVKIKSIPLTLAVIYNVLVDTLLGMIPFFVGNFLDVLVRCHLKNLKLIVGFVQDDRDIIKEVNKKAVFSAIGILVLLGLIYMLFKIVAQVVSWVGGLF